MRWRLEGKDSTVDTQPYVVVKQPCRHGRTFPHSVDMLGNEITDSTRWCADGDLDHFDRDELHKRISETLANEFPKLPLDQVEEKTSQIVAVLFKNLRRAAVV